MGNLSVSAEPISKGGQHVGTPARVMRVQWEDHGETVVAVEMLVPGNFSQWAARNAAISVIDLLLEELRMPPRDNIIEKVSVPAKTRALKATMKPTQDLEAIYGLDAEEVVRKIED